jgi:hypothetical protein
VSEQQNQVTLGADPEFFVKREKTSIPIFDVPGIGGTKDMGVPMTGMPLGFSYLEDGAALEFNIPPAICASDFVTYINEAMNWLKAYVLVPNRLTVANGAVMSLRDRYKEHPKAKVFGCQPDFHAWDATLPGHQRAALGAHNLGDRRCAGFHLHLGYNLAEVPADVAARFMDLFVGLTAVRWDKQALRRKFYGLPGLFRPKPYGIEYRTLSAEIFDHKNKYREHSGEPLLRTLAKRAFLFGGYTYNKLELLHTLYTSAPWADVQSAIENEDGDLAGQITEWLGGQG